MSTLELLQQQAAAEAAVTANMNEAQTGGGGSKLLPEEYCFGRINEYVDLGNQPQEYNGKAKEPAPEFRLGILLYGPKFANDDGTPYQYRTFPMTVSRFEKSGTFKAFAALNILKDPNIRHFAQFLGQGFMFRFTHKTSKATKKTYSDIDWTGTLVYDPVSRIRYDANAPMPGDDDYNLFLWNNPTLVAWDRLHIEGNLDDGRSKNFIQESILGATNYVGSPLELLLAQNGRPSAPVVRQQAPEAPAAAPTVAVVAPVAAPVVAAPSAPVVAPATVPTTAPAAPVVAVPLAQPPAAVIVAPPSTPVIQPGVPSALIAKTSPSNTAPVAVPAVPAA